MRMSGTGFSPADNVLALFSGKALTFAKLLLWTFAAIVSLALFLIPSGSHRSFLINATTQYLTVTFAQGDNKWDLRGAILCIPDTAPDEDVHPDCGFGSIADTEIENQPVVWEAGQTIEIETRQNVIRISILRSKDENFPEGAFFVLREKEWQSTVALVFIGQVTLGQPMSSGVRTVLKSGADHITI